MSAQNGMVPFAVGFVCWLPFLGAVWMFRRSLSSRREELHQRTGVLLPEHGVDSLFRSLLTWRTEEGKASQRENLEEVQPGSQAARYLVAFGASPELQFDRYYALVNYIPPLLCLFVVITGASLLVFASAGLSDPWSAAPVAERIGVLSILAGFAGYFWSLVDLATRARKMDLPPTSLNVLWLRLPLSALIAAAVVPFVAENVRVPVAIGVGLFPLSTVKQFLTQKIPAFATERVPQDPPSLYLIQGMTEDLQTRFAEDGIEIVQHLAYTDPVKLSIRSHVDWGLLIDLIDQALLVQHVGARIELLRALGLRTAIDFKVAFEMTISAENAAAAHRAEATLRTAADRLEVPYEAVLHLGNILAEDPVVKFLFAEWTAESPRVLAQAAS